MGKMSYNSDSLQRLRNRSVAAGNADNREVSSDCCSTIFERKGKNMVVFHVLALDPHLEAGQTSK